VIHRTKFTISERQYKEAVRRASEREAERRVRHARYLAASGMVRRTAEGFRVRDIRFRSLLPAYDVWRDPATRRVTCNCEELKAHAAQPTFRCAHIHAVKFFLEGREPAQEQKAEQTAQIIPFDPARRPDHGAAPFSLKLSRAKLASTCTWGEVATALDRVAPRWGYQVLLVAPAGPLRVKVIASLTIGQVTKMGTGWGSSRSPLGIQRAEDEALRQAAIQFRPVAAALINSGGDDSPGAGTRNMSRTRGGQRLQESTEAKSRATQITPKQLANIRKLESALGFDEDAASLTLYGMPTARLAKRFAVALVLHLQEELDALDDAWSEAYAV
jgi:hypothetical protein